MIQNGPSARPPHGDGTEPDSPYKDQILQKNHIIAILLIIIAVMVFWPDKDEPPPAPAPTNVAPPLGMTRPDPWERSPNTNAPSPFQDPWHNTSPNANPPYFGNSNDGYSNGYNSPQPYNAPNFGAPALNGQPFYPQWPAGSDPGRYQYPYTPGYRFRNPSQTETSTPRPRERYSSDNSNNEILLPQSPAYWDDTITPRGSAFYPYQNNNPSYEQPSRDNYSKY